MPQKNPPPPDVDRVLRHTLLTKLVKSMRDFGYPKANVDNAVTDTVYGMFAERQINEVIQHLKDKGKDPEKDPIGRVLVGVMKEIEAAREKAKAAGDPLA